MLRPCTVKHEGYTATPSKANPLGADGGLEGVEGTKSGKENDIRTIQYGKIVFMNKN